MSAYNVFQSKNETIANNQEEVLPFNSAMLEWSPRGSKRQDQTLLTDLPTDFLSQCFFTRSGLIMSDRDPEGSQHWETTTTCSFEGLIIVVSKPFFTHFKCVAWRGIRTSKNEERSLSRTVCHVAFPSFTVSYLALLPQHDWEGK